MNKFNVSRVSESSVGGILMQDLLVSYFIIEKGLEILSVVFLRK